jgi:hypothetical protein
MMSAMAPAERAASHIRSLHSSLEARNAARDRKLQSLTVRYKSEFHPKCIPIGHDDEVLDRMELSLMHMDGQTKRIRPMPLARWYVTLALLCVTASVTPSFSQGTAEQRSACTPDVFRLCSTFIPDADEITSCLRDKRIELSDACRTALEPGMKQLPSTSESTGIRKRTAK